MRQLWIISKWAFWLLFAMLPVLYELGTYVGIGPGTIWILLAVPYLAGLIALMFRWPPEWKRSELTFLLWPICLASDIMHRIRYNSPPDSPPEYPKEEDMTKVDLNHFNDRPGENSTDWNRNDPVTALVKAYREVVEERDRLISEAKHPTCNDCGVELGDNWCAKCAGKATQHRLDTVLREIANIIDSPRSDH